jgi:hypothetical protein
MCGATAGSATRCERERAQGEDWARRVGPSGLTGRSVVRCCPLCTALVSPFDCTDTDGPLDSPETNDERKTGP